MTSACLQRLNRPILRLAALVILCIGTAGCLLPGEGSRTLRFRPDNRHVDYEYEFSQAYAAPSPEGGYDLVMLNGYTPVSSGYGKRVNPTVAKPISQVVHLHVAWRPARGSKNDYPAATNSSVQWHVFHRESGAATGRVSYGGTGYAAVELGETTSLFQFRDIRIHPGETVGNVHDPIGPSQVFGSVRAINDASTVRDVLAKLEQDLASPPATVSATEPEQTPPPRKSEP